MTCYKLDESTDVAWLEILLMFVRYDFNKRIEDCLSVKVSSFILQENIYLNVLIIIWQFQVMIGVNAFFCEV